MQAFTRVHGLAVPFVRPNVDTDTIVRIERLTSLPKHQLGPYAFESLRYLPDASLDPACVLNAPRFLNAPFLLAGDNFGCGSSREGAVWALMCLGVRAVLAPSYGDIFFSNCFQNGVLPIRLPIDRVQALAAHSADGSPLTVDLSDQTIRSDVGAVETFDVDPTRREALLNGLDDIGLTMRDDALIRTWQARDRTERSWAWRPVAL
ncbi:3-isopropylmalate dehydratase small subunit [Hydrogenophaga sp.]|uniref:3-isopropylmalate dehydratase small subunit n=1 Tax=Hydrogenophaga sp. TaxID=1904254 RepID=UPI00271B132D|nr:3-isopropylmalate dehydratase small subunit [Hydrogenophaga sp.]MDO9435397.1 3-isopropylmalate dehydratase small subunit [Hydrogenophaga sp.]